MTTGPPRHAASTVQMTATWARELVRSQHPDLDGPVSPFANGWDNDVFRLGDELLLRLPRRDMGQEGHRRETTFLPVVGPSLPVPVPTPVRLGVPEGAYPYGWSITPWFAGRTLLDAELDEQVLATGLARFLAALHHPARPDTPRVGARSGLARRDADVRRALASVSDLGVVPQLTSLWEEAVDAPGWRGPAVWVHGDLHPANVLARRGVLAAVLDWGDLFAGDPAPDHAIAWMAMGPAARATFLADLDGDLVCRARGWAVYFCAMLTVAVRQGAGSGFASVAERLIDELCGSACAGRIMQGP